MPPPPKLADESIAVVIPMYNGATHLRKAIESVLAQTMPPQEIILIDDGSRDDSLAIAQSYPGLRVISQKNAGVSATRNRGVSMTSAAWIAFLDQDDYWAPNKLERQIETIRASPEIDVCVVGKRNVAQVGTTDEYRILEADYPPPSQKVASELYRRLRFPPSCVLIRRTALLEVGGFVPVATPCEDWDLWLRMEQAGAIFASCREPLTFYRCHTEMVSSNGPRMYQGEMRVYDLWIAPRLRPWQRPFYRLYYQSQFLAGLALMERDQKKPSLGIMASSILKFPFGYWRRYKIALHMLLRGSGKT
jgi:glycosyltransferase involved in cell wall biosynthesis